MSEGKAENSTPASDVNNDESQKSEEFKTQDESFEDKDSVEDESEKSSGKDSDEEVGLLDRPVEVYGCRARKQVERLEISFASKEKRMEIPEGKGDKLGYCPKIEFHIAKKSINDLKPFHKILFNRVGSGPEIKRNIRKFSGFTFTKDSTEFNKKKVQTEKFTTTALKNICEIIDLEQKGTKEDIVNRILDFLLHPRNSGKKVPKAKQSFKDEKKIAEKKTSEKVKTKKDISSGDDSNSGDGSASEQSHDEEENDDDDSEEDAQKNTKAAKGKKTLAKTVAKKTKKKEKKASKATKRKRDNDSSEHSDEEPCSK